MWSTLWDAYTRGFLVTRRTWLGREFSMPTGTVHTEKTIQSNFWCDACVFLWKQNNKTWCFQLTTKNADILVIIAQDQSPQEKLECTHAHTHQHSSHWRRNERDPSSSTSRVHIPRTLVRFRFTSISFEFQLAIIAGFPVLFQILIPRIFVNQSTPHNFKSEVSGCVVFARGAFLCLLPCSCHSELPSTVMRGCVVAF